MDSITPSSQGLNSYAAPVETQGKIRLLCVTWNMGNAKAENLDHLLPKNGNGVDLIVIGLQESTYNTEGWFYSPQSEFYDSVMEVLGNDWTRVQSAKRAQMQLIMLCRKAIRPRITRTEHAIENTGIFHVLPNKGGILCTCYVDGTSLAFVSTHLAAHEGVKNCQVRNGSIEEILGGVRAGNKTLDPAVQFHHCFWMGDMNYRLTFDPEVPDRAFTDRMATAVVVKDGEEKLNSGKAEDEQEEYEDTDERRDQIAKLQHMIEHEEWDKMLKLDELNREIAAGRVLNDFTALQPNWPPTFKRKRKTAIASKAIQQTLVCGAKKYEVFSDVNDNVDQAVKVATFYDKKRLPSFTDRILHTSLPGFKENLMNRTFESVEQCLSSDHKPVRASFDIDTVEDIHDLKVTADRRGLTMHIFNLKGQDLAEMDTVAFGGGSDPYIVLHTDPKEIMAAGNVTRSKTIAHNLNPVWDEQMELTLVSPDLDGVAKRTHLFLNVWDEDVISADDLIGTLRIPLSDIRKACSKDGKVDPEAQFHFKGDLLANGLVQGHLSGTIMLSVPKFDEKLCTSFSTRSSPTGCGCTVC